MSYYTLSESEKSFERTIVYQTQYENFVVIITQKRFNEKDDWATKQHFILPKIFINFIAELPEKPSTDSYEGSYITILRLVALFLYPKSLSLLRPAILAIYLLKSRKSYKNKTARRFLSLKINLVLFKFAMILLIYGVYPGILIQPQYQLLQLLQLEILVQQCLLLVLRQARHSSQKSSVAISALMKTSVDSGAICRVLTLVLLLNVNKAMKAILHQKDMKSLRWIQITQNYAMRQEKEQFQQIWGNCLESVC